MPHGIGAAPPVASKRITPESSEQYVVCPLELAATGFAVLLKLRNGLAVVPAPLMAAEVNV